MKDRGIPWLPCASSSMDQSSFMNRLVFFSRNPVRNTCIALGFTYPSLALSPSSSCVMTKPITTSSSTPRSSVMRVAIQDFTTSRFTLRMSTLASSSAAYLMRAIIRASLLPQLGALRSSLTGRPLYWLKENLDWSARLAFLLAVLEVFAPFTALLEPPYRIIAGGAPPPLPPPPPPPPLAIVNGFEGVLGGYLPRRGWGGIDERRATIYNTRV
mmetsp:Transcript_4277/g.10357  ORF Transcript_4277/g.10357 Transcript_4277/m.10357 type:complete len:214 (-) Transcript_4277:113-754(-)